VTSALHLARPLSVCSWSLRPRSPVELADAVESVGLTAVQLDLVPLLEESAWDDTALVLADRGIALASGMVRMDGEDYASLEAIARTGGVRPDETWPANFERCRRAATLAAALGIDLVSFHAGFIPEDDPAERDRLLDRLRQVADAFADAGVAVALETGQETADTLVEALEALERPEVGVNFDPANMILYGMGDPVEALRTLAPRVLQLHAKDAVPTETPGTWGREVPVGEGAVDWTSLLETAAVVPELRIAIEREAGDRRIAEIAQARERLESWGVRA
jgi:L-ribulose-5-phosphate 3-epimerase